MENSDIRSPKEAHLASIDFVSRLFWQGQPVDALALAPPMHDGAPSDVAREIYHRLLVRAGNAKLWRRSLVIGIVAFVISAAAPFTTLSKGNIFEMVVPSALSWLLLVVFSWLALTKGRRLMTRGLVTEADQEEAKGIIKRALLNSFPDDTPADLRDMWRHGWLTGDGRPLAAEITEADARYCETSVYASLASGALLALAMAGAALAGNLILAAIAAFSVVAIYIFADDPVARRIAELELQEAVEGVAYAQAGGKPWADTQNAARDAQIAEAIRVKSDLVTLGTSTGLLAARGDPFAPSAGLPFCMSLRDLQQHLVVFGGTGSGKTTGILMPIAQQVASWPKLGLVVMDGKGALPNELAALHMIDGYKVVDPANCKISLVGELEPDAIVDTIRSILGSKSGDSFFDNSAAGLLRRAAVVAKALGKEHWSLEGIGQIATNEKALNAALDAVEKLPNETRVDSILGEATNYLSGEWADLDSKVKSNIGATAKAWISTITAHGDLLGWARAMPEEDSMDILTPLHGGRLGFLLPAHRYGRAGAVVSALLKARLFAALKARAERSGLQSNETPVLFIMDEAQEIATSEDATMLAIGRSLGLAVVAATQTVEGIIEQLGDATARKWLTIFGSALTLTGRSPSTDDFMAGRAGSAWRLTIPSVEGLPVRMAIDAHTNTGAVAASRYQASVREFVAIPGSKLAHSGWQRFTAPIAKALRQVGNTGDGGKKTATTTLAAAPVIDPAELQTLLALPDTAFIQATRARVLRRDVIKLNPLRPGAKKSEKPDTSKTA
jgi:TraM recognition site of TraD and TraG/Type IV secretory system Conjugative DNA transfer